MEHLRLLSRIIDAVKHELAPLSPEEEQAVRAGNQLFIDQQSGLIDSPEKLQERLDLLGKNGINTDRVVKQLTAMEITQNSNLYPRA